ncbi:glycosyltransferase family 4 protein [Atlantibacter subterraneus]|uniref:glycosyltransferase family 4 protein n=1 Tax=Atlantibacter subterraneus TaxID=255519 RepID=UPI00289BAFA6|nr:glycosyltransferase family 4 protein [Atlantibacter subterranea]
MNILLITQNFTIGGLETHLAGQIRVLSNEGHKIHLVVGSEFDSRIMPKELASITTGLRLDSDIDITDFISVVDQLKDIIEKKNIDIIHAQPFYSIIIGAFVAEITHKPLLITLHGPVAFASYLGIIYNFLLKKIILTSANKTLVVSKELEELVKIYSQGSMTSLIPNSIKILDASDCDCQFGKWLCISRLDSQKIKGIFDFIIKAKGTTIQKVVIAGDGPAKDELSNELIKHNLEDFVEFLGYVSDITSIIPDFEGIAGMGRVVLEGGSFKKKIILVGYDGVKGLVTPQLFEKASIANFSGRNLKNITSQQLASDLVAYSNEYSKVNAEVISNEYNENINWKKFSHELNLTQQTAFISCGALLSKLYSIIKSDSQFVNNKKIFYSGEIVKYFGDVVFNKGVGGELSDYYHYLSSQYINEKIETITINNSNEQNLNAQINNITNEFERYKNDKENYIAALKLELKKCYTPADAEETNITVARDTNDSLELDDNASTAERTHISTGEGESNISLDGDDNIPSEKDNNDVIENNLKILDDKSFS